MFFMTASTIEGQKGSTYDCSVRIPNREVLEVFEISIQKWVSRKFGIERDKYQHFISELLAGNLEKFSICLK